MEPSQLLRYVVDQLERLHLPYLVTGSIAVAFFGEPRFTNEAEVRKYFVSSSAGHVQ